MGQIVGTKAKPKRANLNALSQVGIPALGEYVLVSSDNSMSADGQGNFDCYVVGDGVTTATELGMHNICDANVINVPVGHDLDVADDNGFSLVRFQDGHIETKYFNSKTAAFTSDQNYPYDLAISDEDGNVIFNIIDGHIHTKNFNSEYYGMPQNLQGATQAFVNAMTKKANKMGLSITINGPAGYPDNQVSDARSMAKLFLVASSYRELADIWNTIEDVTITSKGAISGTHLLHSTVFSTDSQGHYASQLTNYYTMLGGKTGTWSSPAYNMLGAIIKGPNDILLAAWLRRNAGESSSNNRWKSMKILMDIAFAKLQDASADISILENSLESSGVNSAQVLRVPNNYPINYELFDFYGDDSRYTDYAVYGYMNTTQLPIASTTKVLTAITALDYISDLETLVEIVSSDIISGSTSTNPEFVAGEKFTVRELLLSMMLPSSNAAANAIARYVGSILITNKY